ncbi:MAG TPA: TIGR04282 family arsenosugar biosynthesis glycosyltransferase [Candidatus Omnitrophota bacterium]|nr:TIGR04282 family arsenosugar biosynthesis glycosyltransferase [Candidatus Omnitrophota bacterium]
MSGDAVALFAKTPRPGTVKTRLSPPLSPDEAAAVARVCLEETLRRFPAAVPASWTLFLDGALEPWLARLAANRGVAIAAQGDGDLGARLDRAFRALHEGGARRAVAIGADSPTLEPARIASALERLDRADAVLGPARDGGYYLIGIRPGREAIFSGIPWGTPGVADATRRRAAESGWTVAELPEWYDVDDAEGLRRAAADAAECPELLRVVAALGARLEA